MARTLTSTWSMASSTACWYSPVRKNLLALPSRSGKSSTSSRSVAFNSDNPASKTARPRRVTNTQSGPSCEGSGATRPLAVSQAHASEKALIAGE